VTAFFLNAKPSSMDFTVLTRFEWIRTPVDSHYRPALWQAVKLLLFSVGHSGPLIEH
jgi:hypothetical protein